MEVQASISPVCNALEFKDPSERIEYKQTDTCGEKHLWRQYNWQKTVALLRLAPIRHASSLTCRGELTMESYNHENDHSVVCFICLWLSNVGNSGNYTRRSRR